MGGDSVTGRSYPELAPTRPGVSAPVRSRSRAPRRATPTAVDPQEVRPGQNGTTMPPTPEHPVESMSDNIRSGQSIAASSDVPPVAPTHRITGDEPEIAGLPETTPFGAQVNLRRQDPAPVVPWTSRARSWLRQRTPEGRSEDRHDVALADLLAWLATGTQTIAVIGPKGGAGKSTTALVAGLVLAQTPLARPILVEVNPDWGTLDELLGGANPRTIADLLRDYTAIDRAGIGLLQGYVTMFGRLPVLTAPSDPDAMARLTPRDYDRVLRLLALHYNVIVLDCGTAFTQRLNQFAIQRAGHLVVVGWPEQATMRKTLAAIDYLASARYERDYRGLLAEVADGDGRGEIRARALADVTLALNGVGHTGGADPIDPARVRAAAAGLHAVVDLPFTPALRALLADGTLTIEALPGPYRRAAKALLVAALGGLTERPAPPLP